MTNILASLQNSAQKNRKRIGRGNGSGHGTYATRGMKGQKSRSGKKLRPGFEGGRTPLIIRMPKLPGFRNINRVKYQAINISDLAKHFQDGDTVGPTEIFQAGLNNQNLPVKILSDGELSHALTITAHAASRQAQAKLTASGSKLSLLKTRKKFLQENKKTKQIKNTKPSKTTEPAKSAKSSS